MQIKISELPQAAVVNPEDVVPIVQNGQTMQAASSMFATYNPGDTVAIATSSIFCGVGASATSFRFLIPLMKHINAASVEVVGTGSFRAVHDGSSSGYKNFGDDGGELTLSIVPSGIAVQVNYTTSPSWLSSNMNYSVNLTNTTFKFN